MKKSHRFFGISSLVWIFVLITIWAGLVVAFNKTPFQNDITQFFPNPHSLEAQYLKKRLAPDRTALEATHQTADQTAHQVTHWMMLAVKSGHTPQTVGDISRATQQQLLKIKGVKQVLNGSEAYQSPLQQTPVPALYTHRYLLTPFDLSNLPSQIAQRWQEYQLGFVLDKNWLLEDPSFHWALYQNQLKPSQQLAKKEGVWVNEQHGRALLLIEVQQRFEQDLETGARKDPGNSSEKEIEQTLEHLLGRENFELSGAEWIAQQAEQQIKTAVNWTTGLASGMIFLALWIAFRSPKLLFLSSLPLLGAVAVGILSTITLFGSMQLIPLALGAILLGVAIDYPIHTFSAYQSKQSRVVQKIWPTIRLGALTSAFGFLTLWWVEIQGLQQMAIFAASGLLTALIITGALKPYLAAHYQVSPPHKGLESTSSVQSVTPALNKQTPLQKNAQRFVLPGLVIISAVILWLKPIQWQDDIASLSPVSEQLIQTDQQLRALFGYQEVGKQLLLTAKEIETLLQSQEALTPSLQALQTSGSIQNFQLLSHILPSLKRQAERQQSLPNSVQVAAALQHAVEGTRFTAQHFQPFTQALEQSRQQPLLTYQQFIQADDASAQLARQWVVEMPDQFLGVIPLSGVASDAAIQTFVDQHADLGLLYFNQRALVAEQIRDIRSELFKILGFILALLSFIIWLKYRQFKHTWLVLSPIAVAILFTLVSFTLLDIPLSIFHLMSLMLVAAIGIDYSLLFFEGARQSEHAHEWNRSIRVAFLTTLGSFGILSISQLALLNAIGLTVLIGVLWVYSLALFTSKMTGPAEKSDESLRDNP